MYDYYIALMIDLASPRELKQFAFNQAMGMVSPSHKKQSAKFKHEPSIIVAVSSLSYLIPAICMICMDGIDRQTKWIDFVIYTIMSFVSLCGDYIYCYEEYNLLHLLDQWTATAAICLNFFKVYSFYDDHTDILWVIGSK